MYPKITESDYNYMRIHGNSTFYKLNYLNT